MRSQSRVFLKKAVFIRAKNIKTSVDKKEEYERSKGREGMVQGILRLA